MGFWKVAGVIAGGVVAVIAAPIVLPVAGIAGTAALAVGTAAASTAAAVGTAAAGTVIGGAVVGAAGSVAAGAAALGTAAAGTAVGTAVAGAAGSVAAGAAALGTAAASTAVGTAVVGAASTVATSSVLAGTTAAVIGSGLTYSGLTTVDGFMNMSEAKDKIAKAKSVYGNKTNELEKEKEITSKKLEDLNQYKMRVYVDVIGKSIDEIIKKIKVPKESEIDFLDKDISYLFSRSEIDEIDNISMEAKVVLKQVLHGASLMQTAAGSSLGFVSTFGAASTGTAISSLSGAAATNATLAFFGGGAIASGGGGMALGSSVLGGITVIPAAIILSNQYAKQSEESLTAATKYYAEVREEVGKIDVQMLVLKEGVNIRIEEIRSTIKMIENIYAEKVYPKLLATFNRNKNSDGYVNYKECSISEQKNIKQSTYFLKKLKELLGVKMID